MKKGKGGEMERVRRGVMRRRKRASEEERGMKQIMLYN